MKMLAFTSAFGGSALVGALVLAAGVGVSMPAFALPPPWIVFCRNLTGYGTPNFNESKFEACAENMAVGGGKATPENGGSEMCLATSESVNGITQYGIVENWGNESGAEIVGIEGTADLPEDPDDPDIAWGGPACFSM